MVFSRLCREPFGAVHAITGPAANDNRFPGQMFQLEAGLAYNWHRHYDASVGRYTQADPLGLTTLLSDGPSVYGYVGQSPLMWVDETGESLFKILRELSKTGAKSIKEAHKHLKDARDGQRRIEDLVQRCKQTKSPKEREKLFTEYNREVDLYKGHMKEIGQNFPEVPRPDWRVPKWPR